MGAPCYQVLQQKALKNPTVGGLIAALKEFPEDTIVCTSEIDSRLPCGYDAGTLESIEMFEGRYADDLGNYISGKIISIA